MDYGHEKYLNSLITQKLTALRALERVVQRRAEQEIDNQRETEQKRVKREAALFRRQAKEIQRRMQELRAKEDAQRQEEYLEQAYQQRLAEESDAESWDPIEDVLENERGTYVDLITHFLWSKDQSPESTIPDSTTLGDGTAANKSEKESSQSIHKPGGEEAPSVPEKEPSGPQKARKKKQGAKHKKTQEKSNQDSELVAVNSVKETSSPPSRSMPVVTSTPPQRPDKEPDFSQIESREEMRSRLLQGTKIRQVIVMSKKERLERMPPMPAPEVDRLLEEIAEIKSYLFCRLLLGNSVLLPSAMKAANFQELFNDPEVKTQDLRDLCLKLEQPQLQEIRDACADFFRRDGATEEGPEEDSDEGDSSEDDVDDAPVRKRKSKHPLPPVWQSKREKAKKAAGKRPPPEMMEALKHMDATEQEPGSRIDFGTMNDARNIKQTNSRIKICGRYIYNYPSESRLSRGGWLHFNIIAKDCSLFKAVELCKSWDEFYELSLLTVYVYFPSPEWLRWAVGSIRQHYLHAGFVPFYVSDDTISRAFIQKASMYSSQVFILVRDGKTGRILVEPPEDELWLVRQRSGYGRASRAEWETIRYVGPRFFEEMERHRSFRLGFDDYYDIYIWNSNPKDERDVLHVMVTKLLYKARRVRRPEDFYSEAAPYLKTLTVDKGSFRARDVRENENVPTIWDEMQESCNVFSVTMPDGQILKTMPKQLVYTEADALEDAILFPEENDGAPRRRRFKALESELSRFENARSATVVLDQWINNDGQPELADSDNPDMDSAYDSEEEDDDPEPHDKEWTDVEPDNDENDHIDRELLERLVRQLDKTSEILDSFPPYRAPNESDELDQSEDEFDVEDDFMMFVDLWKSRIFKKAWHNSDLEPGAQARWEEYIALRAEATQDFIVRENTCVPCAQMLKFLDYHPETHSRVMRDAVRAYIIVWLFSSKAPAFFNSKAGSKFKSSKLFAQEERSKELPDRRSGQSCRYRDDSFYHDLDKQLVDYQRGPFKDDYSELPYEWDVVIRPKIAQFFKNGLIHAAHKPFEQVLGTAFAAQEEGRPHDLFFDFRGWMKQLNMNKALSNPYDISIDSLRQDASNFAKRWPGAKFALLRLWSAPHFYPYMLGPNNRDMNSFVDAIGRTWTWKFLPKDMAFSEWSVHYNVAERLRPFMDRFRFFGDPKVRVRKDVVLVMGANEEELLKLAASVTFLIQTRPWRTEIDFWKSFVNVDDQFLTSLHDVWWA
ncbi:hypothetical protein KCU88_g5960, partial [Aureobasidium melanogenum]